MMSEIDAQKILSEMRIPMKYKGIKIEIGSSKCPLGCNLCVSSCPTNALYFFQKVNVQQELCVGCGACIFSCMYDGIIRITRTSESGIMEKFDSKRSFVLISNSENSRKRVNTV